MNEANNATLGEPVIIDNAPADNLVPETVAPEITFEELKASFFDLRDKANELVKSNNALQAAVMRLCESLEFQNIPEQFAITYGPKKVIREILFNNEGVVLKVTNNAAAPL